MKRITVYRHRRKENQIYLRDNGGYIDWVSSPTFNWALDKTYWDVTRWLEKKHIAWCIFNWRPRAGEPQELHKGET